ncbi:MAG: alpha-amylase [Planctomycetes bacterium]|nr:alpha-amylase [Planctomycetota bacterium]
MDYRLPALWDCWGYAGPRTRTHGQIIVNAREYVAACLEWIRGQSPPDAKYARRSLSRVYADHGARSRSRGRPGDWIADQTMYGMMVRMTTAWDHDADGRIAAAPGRRRDRYQELGTFLKSCLVLPLLAKMGVTTLYLLPVVKISNLFRKGELGCPYSAKDFLQLDASLHDPLAGDDPAAVKDEFAVFVECAHRLGMRVMLDVAPRTAARDCDWILEHPEWFYWIDRRFEADWRAPRLPDVHYENPIPGRLDEVYRVPAVREHLQKFRVAPSITHPREWAEFAAGARRRPPENLMAAIAHRFGVITPPGFSDVINDRQPAWSDVTYFRLYLDHAPEAAALLEDPERQPPYVLFDTIKCNLFPGRRPNRELWNRLADIIPFYQQFGIDGARLDMAHALPSDLERTILDRPRRRDPDFCFFAEDLSARNHARVRKAGYNVLLGPSWYCQPRASDGQMHRMLAELPSLKLPVLAAAETPDTPRATVRRGGPRFSRQAVVVNMFLPNAVPMINSGMEVLERQPMNLGLDVGRPGRYALPRRDPQYGKLAFFDPYALHWTNPGGPEMVDLIARASALRRRFLPSITRKAAWFFPKLATNAHHILATGFRVPGTRKSLLMLANIDMNKPRRTTVVGLRSPRDPKVLLEIVPSPAPRLTARRLTLTLAPGDVKIVRA